MNKTSNFAVVQGSRCGRQNSVFQAHTRRRQTAVCMFETRALIPASRHVTVDANLTSFAICTSTQNRTQLIQILFCQTTAVSCTVPFRREMLKGLEGLTFLVIKTPCSVAQEEAVGAQAVQVGCMDHNETKVNRPTYLLLPPPKEVMFLLRSVCLSVCLSVCMYVRRITEKVVNGF